MMIPKTIIHLLSGGLDSVTMLHDLKAQGHSIHCLLIDYSQPHVQELEWARYHVRVADVLYTEMKLPELGGLNKKSWVVPNRNAVFLSFAVSLAVRARANTVTIGCNADDAELFPDCRKPFIDSMNVAVKAAGIDVEICAPYLDRNKSWIVNLARDMRIKLNELWTCYHGGEKPCGECPACIKLESAMG